jgi:hypothetical protein
VSFDTGGIESAMAKGKEISGNQVIPLTAPSIIQLAWIQILGTSQGSCGRLAPGADGAARRAFGYAPSRSPATTMGQPPRTKPLCVKGLSEGFLIGY